MEIFRGPFKSKLAVVIIKLSIKIYTYQDVIIIHKSQLIKNVALEKRKFATYYKGYADSLG